MSAEEAARYRGMVARCNFQGCDRPDIQYVAKEPSRWMANPCQRDYEKVGRRGTYLNSGCLRLVQSIPFGKGCGVVMSYSASEWAGCLRARRSTSAGDLFIGSWIFKHALPTHKAIALSSAGAELYAATRAPSQAKVLQSLAMDFGEDLCVRAHADAQATIGLHYRAGVGKARHTATAELWIQDALERQDQEFVLVKVPRERGPADVITKPGGRGVMNKHLDLLGYRAVRADTSP